jgi:KaiC domain protein
VSDDDWFERAISNEDGDPPDDEESDGDAADTASDGATDTETGVDSPFDVEFSEAFEGAPPPGSGRGKSDDTGAFPGDDGAVDTFDEEPPDFSGSEFEGGEFQSSLDLLDVGIEGLDEMILGGIPVRSLIATIGSAGTGKTTVGMQFLNEALENDERAVYITLEESREQALDTAAEKEWAFREYEEAGTLAVVDLDPVEMANSLSSIRNDLTRLIQEFGAERLLLDSVSLLEMMYDHPAQRRSEVFQFTRALKRAGVTTLVTSEANTTDPFTSRYGIVEYLADAVFVLQYVRSNEFQETRLAIEIQKIRDANHSRQPKPYEITGEGISVHQRANLF